MKTVVVQGVRRNDGRLFLLGGVGDVPKELQCLYLE
jgi:hypothetical protein